MVDAGNGWTGTRIWSRAMLLATDRLALIRGCDNKFGIWRKRRDDSKPGLGRRFGRCVEQQRDDLNRMSYAFILYRICGE